MADRPLYSDDSTEQFTLQPAPHNLIVIREITGRPRPHLHGGLVLAEAIEKVATDDVVVDFRCIRQWVWKGVSQNGGSTLNHNVPRDKA